MILLLKHVIRHYMWCDLVYVIKISTKKRIHWMGGAIMKYDLQNGRVPSVYTLQLVPVWRDRVLVKPPV